eukprot:TRINITY_DN16392_c0_g1_i1.p1 TRINITY_DN16392_c0_g1~~TRINITY_DN16392_c0_g1_i1.p1  ORF type:complete len:717 (-),score=192.86 TRINITY_DN16392_c0_g1_i1:126-2276(-)
MYSIRFRRPRRLPRLLHRSRAARLAIGAAVVIVGGAAASVRGFLSCPRWLAAQPVSPPAALSTCARVSEADLADCLRQQQQRQLVSKVARRAAMRVEAKAEGSALRVARGARRGRSRRDRTACVAVASPSEPAKEGGSGMGVAAAVAGGVAAAVAAALKLAEDAGEDAAVAIRESSLLPDEEHFIAVLTALREEGYPEQVARLFKEMRGTLPVSCEAFSQVLKAQRDLQRWSSVIDVYRLMERQGFDPVLEDRNAMLQALRKVGRVDEAVERLDDMASSSSGSNSWPDAESYSTVLKGLRRVDQSDTSLRLLMAMKDRKLVPDIISYTSSLRSIMRAQQWEDGLQVFDEMRGPDGVGLSSENILVTLRGLVGAGQLPKAGEILAELEASHMDLLSQAHYDFMIHAYDRANKFQEVVGLASRMGAAGIEPHEITTGTVLGACRNLGLWQAAIQVLGTLTQKSSQERGEDDEEELHLSAYATVLRACADAGQWEEVLRLNDELKSRAEDEQCLAAFVVAPVLAALYEADRHDEAAKLYRQAARAGHFRLWRRQRLGPGPSFLDARMLLPQVAAIAVKTKLEDGARAAEGDTGMLSSGIFSPMAAVNANVDGVVSVVSNSAAAAPRKPEDLIIILQPGTFDAEGEGDGALQAVSGTPAHSILEAAREVLGPEARIETSTNPMSFRIPGSELQALLVKRVQQAVSEFMPGSEPAAVERSL